MNRDVQTKTARTNHIGYLTRLNRLFPAVCLVVLGCLLFSTSSRAAKLLIIGDMKQPVHQKLVDKLGKQFLGAPQNLIIQPPTLISKNSSSASEADLIITLGLAAAKSASRLTSDTPIFFSLLPKTLAEKFTECLTQTCSQKRAALFLDQPIERQVNLIRLIFPAAKRLSFLYGDFSLSAASALNEIAKIAGYETDSVRIKNSDQLPSKLNALLQETELLLALPDPVIHNRQTIPQLLLSTYRYNIPIIGFSKSYVSAGAIAAVFSSLDDLANELAFAINHFEKNGQLPTNSGYPKRYRVQINRDVARSMNLRIPSSERLLKELLALENEP